MTNKLMFDNLSSVTSGVDLTKVPPIHQKRLLTFVNHFIITTVSFLNTFAQTCERKLLHCDKKMQKLEAELCILEAKLNSIPGLGEIQEEGKAQDNIRSSGTVTKETDRPELLIENSSTTNTDKDIKEPAESESESATPSAAKDPALARFFKMVQFGVPVPAVKLKMQQEGFDPNLLDS